MFTAQGITYKTIEAAEARLAELDAENALYGESDGRVTEQILIREAIAAAPKPQPQRAEEPKPRYTGATVNNSKTGTIHFVNGWGETFCGRYASEIGVTVDYGYRATCGTCRAAGDAALRDGTGSAGGSAARRN